MKQEIISKIESILFATGEPVGKNKLAKFLKIPTKKLDQEIKELEKSMKERKSGLQIVQNGNRIQLVSHAENGELIAKFLNKQLNEPLSKAALEVLAVVAYRGPVNRASIEHIRGVNCSFTLRTLAMKGLIEIVDNPENGRTYLYKPSLDFLKSIGIERIGQLPDYQELNKKD